ncbi:D-alanyl-D-alanine carboxypeptidase family protein [Thermoactinospora rubra]|uniref:D-alanyl-D-alanine carboxypeptidase family protein n=1 Tax=Thermoactinospora rubra TaxID=1088767 RepID=UPI001F0A58D3|nr:serine hydrolase [Thermoactinospora rubra]
MRMGALIRVLLCALVCTLAGFAVPTAASPARAEARAGVQAGAPPVAARAAYVADSEGTVHVAKRADRRTAVASLVKIMTAYVVLREAELDDVVRVTRADVRHAAANGATAAALRAGERLTVRDLLYGLMLPSGADAANALARTYGPGKAAFVAKMNAAASALGLHDTRYANADGLPSSGYSTAADQVKLAQAALRQPEFRAIVGRQVYRVAKTTWHSAHVWRNTNKLFGMSDGVIGVKTGYTRAAGYCLLFAAERDGVQVVGALLGDQDSRRFATAARLLDYAFPRVAA